TDVLPFPRESSPPDPLSLRERGDERRPPECIPQEPLEPLACDITVPDADHVVPGSFEQPSALSIVGLSAALIMRIALELQHQPFGGRIEVNDTAVQHVLAAARSPQDAQRPQTRAR